MRKWKVRLIRLATFGAAVFCSTICDAGPFQYDCEVKQVAYLEKGAATPAIPHGRVGLKFIINRRSGEVAGDEWFVIPLGKALQVTVLDSGSSSETFKLIAHDKPPPSRSIYIEVNEYESGPNKSFIHVENAIVSTGICK